jgi:Rad3-related DNA helicase
MHSGPALWQQNGPVAQACVKLSQPYTSRAEQQDVARLIEAALSRQQTQAVGILPIEAGTGIGKTLAYLVPGALHAMAHGSRMLVSTHTIALGTQIMRKDGLIAQAVVETALGQRPRLAHMRGRSSFLSASRARAVGNLLREDGIERSGWKPYLDLADIAERAMTEASQALVNGDMSENARALVEVCLLDQMEDETGVWLSREDVCLLASSPENEHTIHQLARALANDATILVTTHAYTAIALARQALFGSATDPFDILVIDEADQWASAAVSASLLTLSLSELRRTIEAVMQSSRHIKNSGGIERSATEAINILDRLQNLAPKDPNTQRFVEHGDSTIKTLINIGDEIDQILKFAEQNRQHTAAAADALRERARTIKLIGRAVSNSETDFWIATWKTSRIQGLPSITVQGRAPGRILKRLWTPREGGQPLARTVVLASATLATPGFTEQNRWKAIEIATGADPSSTMVLSDLAASIQPINFGRLRVRFADPRAPIPRINNEGQVNPEAMSYTVAVILAAMENSRAKKGRTLVLVPAYSDIEQLEPMIPAIRFHHHGEKMRRLLDEYQATEGCCLVTPGAWVGADLPGMVQNLVITRIPFPPRETENNSIPRILSVALGKLAQGIGRAIRKHDDDAILWFADSRMPIPDSITEETGLRPSLAANPVLLGAIPKRFRDDFGRIPGAAAIAVPWDETRSKNCHQPSNPRVTRKSAQLQKTAK